MDGTRAIWRGMVEVIDRKWQWSPLSNDFLYIVNSNVCEFACSFVCVCMYWILCVRMCLCVCVCLCVCFCVCMCVCVHIQFR